ncbi:MAG TPA: hypothetical protein VIM55_10700 [Mucilaginibacter sp.]
MQTKESYFSDEITDTDAFVETLMFSGDDDLLNDRWDDEEDESFDDMANDREDLHEIIVEEDLNDEDDDDHLPEED